LAFAGTPCIRGIVLRSIRDRQGRPNSNVVDNDWEQRQSTTGSGKMVWYKKKTGEEAPLEDDFNWADWDELEDPQSGAIFYYNRQTGETQWA